MEIKPQYLYHASSDRSIEVLEPRQESYRDIQEGKVVFATDDKAYSSMFIIPSDDSWTTKSGFKIGENPRIWVTYISDEKRYKELDKGGAIYTLGGESFFKDDSKNKSEWISYMPVIPLRKEIYESGINAMINSGVQVYFVSKKEFEILQNDLENSKHVFNILSKMESENEKMGFSSLIKTLQ